MANVGPLEILVVLVIALILFGPKRIPELGQSLGKSFREFKAALDGDEQPSEQKVAGEGSAPRAEVVAPTGPNDDAPSETQG